MTALQKLKVITYFRSGWDERGWYKETQRSIRFLFGKARGDMFLKIIAATSANTTVKANITLAFKALHQWMSGVDFEGYLPSVIANLQRCETGEPLQGPKISAFYRALAGDPNAVVIDRWILRAYGYKSLTPTVRREIIDSMHELADEYDCEPREVQAAIWFGVKKAHGDTLNNDPYEFHIFERMNNLEEENNA
jgi:hypothetical protein